MEIYEYIALNDPQGAQRILQQFGYQVMNVETATDLGQCLSDLVAQEGDEALTEIAAIHPDKELILEKFSGKPGSGKGNGDCGCKWCKKSMQFMEKKGFGDLVPSSPATLLIISGTVLCTVALIMRS